MRLSKHHATLARRCTIPDARIRIGGPGKRPDPDHQTGSEQSLSVGRGDSSFNVLPVLGDANEVAECTGTAMLRRSPIRRAMVFVNAQKHADDGCARSKAHRVGFWQSWRLNVLSVEKATPDRDLGMSSGSEFGNMAPRTRGKQLSQAGKEGSALSVWPRANGFVFAAQDHRKTKSTGAAPAARGHHRRRGIEAGIPDVGGTGGENRMQGKLWDERIGAAAQFRMPS